MKAEEPARLQIRALNDQTIEAEAERWTQRFAAHGRWSGNPEASAQVEKEAAELLGSCEVDTKALHPGEDGTWRAEFAFEHADLVKAAGLARLPWESLLGETTRRDRGTRALVATRIVHGLGDAPPFNTGKPLLVAAEPRDLSGLYPFASELKLLERGAGTFRPVIVPNPTRDELAQAVADGNPQWVHITGFDAEQGAQLMNREPQADGITGSYAQGLYMKSADGSAEIVPPERLAQATDATPLVTFNFYNSEDAMCVHALRAGALAAIGLQRGVPDDLAEAFFFVFYRELGQAGETGQPGLTSDRALGQISEAFEVALTKIREKHGLRGTEIRLWRRG